MYHTSFALTCPAKDKVEGLRGLVLSDDGPAWVVSEDITKERYIRSLIKSLVCSDEV